MSSSEVAYTIAVVCEGSSDRRIAQGLAGRVLAEKIEWLDEDVLVGMWRWRGYGTSEFLSFPGILPLAKELGIVRHGKFGGKSGLGDERLANQALLIFQFHKDRFPDAVVFVRDTDNNEWYQGIERARDEGDWPFPVVIATPHTKRECWVLNGFEPQDDDEEAALQAAKQKLGFDPCREAEKLTGKRKSRKKNAKLVLQNDLGVQPDSDREDACWQRTELDVLRDRGERTLLTAYLDEVVERLAPVFSE